MCPCCSHDGYNETAVVGVYQCTACGCVYGQCYRGDVSQFVLPYWAENADSQEVIERQQHYDLTILQGDGKVVREHGWRDPVTKRITQVG